MPHNSEVIKATSQDLKEYIDAKHNKKTAAENFCIYLKEKYNSSQAAITADLSGEIFENLNLQKIDLGNVILGEYNGQNTGFQNCDLTQTKLRSGTSMQGLEFNRCVMNYTSIAGNLAGVKFGPDSDISYINLKEAFNIGTCIMDSECMVSHIELGFPDLQTFKAHTEKQIEDHIKTQQDRSRHEAEISRRKAKLLPSSPAAASMSDQGENVSDTQILSDKNTLTRIIKSAPEFHSDLKSTDESEKYYVTQEQVQEWRNTYLNTDEEKMTLSEYLSMDIEDKVFYLNSLDLKELDFSGLEFGEVSMSKCDFSGCTFHATILNGISARDCRFDNAKFSETEAKKSDFTRSSFKGAEMDKLNFESSVLLEADFSSGYLPTQISNTGFTNANMRSADLDTAKITFTAMDNANMQDIKGESVMLFNVRVEESNLSDADLPDAVMRNVTLINSTAHDVNLEGGVIEYSDIISVEAEGINLDNTNQKHVTYKDTNISNGTLNEAVLGDVAFIESKMTDTQAQEIKTYIPPLSEDIFENITTAEAREAVENLELKDEAKTGETDRHNMITEVLEAKQQEPAGIILDKVDGIGLDLSGSYLVAPKIINNDLSDAKMHNTVIETGLFQNTVLQEADLSSTGGKYTELIDTEWDNVDARGASLKGIRVLGGEWNKADIRGMQAPDAILGLPDAPLDIHNIKAGETTNLADAELNITDTKAKGREAVMEVTDSKGDVEIITPEKLKEKNELKREREANYTAYPGEERQLEHAVGPEANGSKQQSNFGSRAAAFARAGIASVVLVPVALIAAPAIAFYNLAKGKHTSFRRAFAAAVDTVIINPVKKISGKFASEDKTGDRTARGASVESSAQVRSVDSHSHENSLPRPALTKKRWTLTHTAAEKSKSFVEEVTSVRAQNTSRRRK